VVRGFLVVNVDPSGPCKQAGMLVGDTITAWSGKPIDRVREITQLAESVGTTVDLSRTRRGTPTVLELSSARDR
jgi:S1-C subfamily serine protease